MVSKAIIENKVKFSLKESCISYDDYAIINNYIY